MERFLYRLSLSPYAERFILKGALMFNVWGAPASRPTRDIDLLGCMNNSVDALLPVFRDVCRQKVEPDGLVFPVESLQGEIIKEDADYAGVRVKFQGFLDKSQVAMQIDIGFGDAVEPQALLTDYPTILDLRAPRLRAYPKETVVAEKFEAMVKLGQLNSRLKDFFDLWLLSQQFAFDGTTLASAVLKTFKNRQTAINSQPVALSAIFANDPTKQKQWKGFLRKSQLELAPPHLPNVVDTIGGFLLPLAEALASGRNFSNVWQPRGPWQSSAKEEKGNRSN
ncbi:MAG: nucleotidyl transferase AbiEii/AbiGii toxin family protein [Planctomycetota bacterium]|nr:nucleotidyl transferase AbiEii/AbiGii toxin family protein [Planctomycetota bacterium]